MGSVTFTIPGRVGGKGRPRAVRRGNFVSMYTPEKTRSTEAMVRQFASDAMRGKELLDGPLRLTVSVFQQPTESWSKKRKAAAKWITGKPDVDNVIKLLGDSMNGIVFKDDAQIASVLFQRCYRMGQPEEVIVTVGELSEGG